MGVRGIRTEGVARLSLRELIHPRVRNYQVITDDLHLKKGLLTGRICIFMSLCLVIFTVLITHFLLLSFSLLAVQSVIFIAYYALNLCQMYPVHFPHYYCLSSSTIDKPHSASFNNFER